MSDGQMQTVLAALGRLEAGQMTMGARMDTMRADIDTMRADMAAVRANMVTHDDLNGVRAAIMERIDRLQHAIEIVKEDVVVSYGSNDRIERLAKSALDDSRALGEVVRAMQRQIMRLRTDLDQLRDAGGSA